MSSARAVRCSVKSGNERNPYRVLYMSRETARNFVHNILRTGFREECGDDVKSAWPSDALGDTRATMVGTKGCQTARWSQSQKADLSSDWSLQLDSMKPESLVIVNQPRHGEYVLGSCTHRPSHQESW